MKILCVHQGWEMYGSDRSFLLNVKLLKDNPKISEISIIISKEGIIVQELLKLSPNVKVGLMGKVERLMFKSAPFRSLFKIIKESFIAFNEMKKVDLIYINTIAPYSYLLASIFFRRNVVVHVREIPPKFLAKVLSFWFLLSKVNVVFNSVASCRAFSFENKRNGWVIPNAVSPIKVVKRNTHNSKINVLLIGRINSWKGHFFLIETLSKLDKDVLQAYHFVFLGSPPEGQDFYLADLKKKIEENKLVKNITIEGFVKEPSTWYNWAHYVIVPSIHPEPFGRVAIEAFSVSKPVIAANHGGLSEIVSDNEDGFLFSPGNSEELIAVLVKIYRKDVTYAKLSENAFSKYCQNYSIEVYRKKFERFLQTL